jgi:nitrite reductase/ring-hydroxylating ferredoxin subunit
MAAAAVVLPMAGQSARADATTAPGAGSGDGTWIKTIKPADLADKSAQAIMDDTRKTQTILARDGKSVIALSPKCTHKGCTVKVVPATELACPCHGAEFDFSGKNTSGPHKSPATLAGLARFALRLNADGVIEVDVSQPVDAASDKATLTLAG